MFPLSVVLLPLFDLWPCCSILVGTKLMSIRTDVQWFFFLMSLHNSLVQFYPLHLLLIKPKNMGPHALEKDRGITIMKKTYNRTIPLILRHWLVGRLRQTRRKKKKKIRDPHLSEVCSLPALFLHPSDSQFSSRLKQLGFQIKAVSPLWYCTRFLSCFFIGRRSLLRAPAGTWANCFKCVRTTTTPVLLHFVEHCVSEPNNLERACACIHLGRGNCNAWARPGRLLLISIFCFHLFPFVMARREPGAGTSSPAPEVLRQRRAPGPHPDRHVSCESSLKN